MQCKDMPWIESDSAAAEFMTTASEAELERAMKEVEGLAERLGRLHAPTRDRLNALALAMFRKGCDRFGESFAVPF